jgi:Family of unknown function (DUF6292)
MPCAEQTIIPTAPGRAGGHTRHGHEAPRGEDVLVVAYLSAVAAALDERGITVIMLCREGQPEALAGTLVLHPSTARAGHGWGPTRACWHQNTGWSIQFYRGISGHVTAGRYLHSGSVPSPAVVAQFVAAVAAGRDVGASTPPQLPGDRQELLTQLDRFRADAPRTSRAAGRSAGPAPTAVMGTGSGRVGAGGDDTRCGAPAGGARDGAAADEPPRPPTLQQRQEALAKAAPARAARRRLCEQVARGELSIAAVLDRARADPVVAKTRVVDLLTALPGYGSVTVAALLCDARIHPARRVGGLGRRQRLALLEALSSEPTPLVRTP